jgi:hypothetical protein
MNLDLNAYSSHRIKRKGVDVLTMALDAYNTTVMAYNTPTTGPLSPKPHATNHMGQLQENVWRLLEGDEPKNMLKAIEQKMKRFMYYCNSIYLTDSHYSILMKEKMYNFMFCLAFLGAKKKGGSQSSQSNDPPFEVKNYRLVLGFSDLTAGTGTVFNLPQPNKLISKLMFDQYKAML